MKLDNLGLPRFADRDIIDLIYKGNANKIGNIFAESSAEVKLFNKIMEDLRRGIQIKEYQEMNVPQEEFDGILQNEWFMPEKYKKLNIEEYLSTIVSVKSPEWKVVSEELKEFNKRNMYPLLQFLVYLVDFMRDNKIVWGVGRGSSVASYVLYAIGIHKINPIQYGLDWREFLR
ncbi:MAG: hypothetical protein CMP33_04955 [Rickettsiales bacterium]|nr:hypothetical protein [Rickettsiales bacterium]|tara:strand:+ start:30254 stop:30775 length:522 start_codon:yes stop_codon:yes gene_type:complete